MKEFYNQIREKVEEIKNSPGTIFGLVFPYFLTIGLIIGLYFVSNLEFISRQKVPPVILDTVLVSDLTFQESKQVPPVDLNQVKTATTELLLEGENLYKINCASCHGETGAGGGPASVGMNPAPRNFTSKDGWKNGTKISGIYSTLQEGISGTSMIAYDFLKPQEKFALAHYIRNKFIPEPETDSDDDIKSLDALYNLSAGSFTPAQIPVTVAEQIKLNETASQSLLVQKINEKLKQSNSKDTIEKYLLNKKAAFSYLVKNKDWRKSPEQLRTIAAKSLENNIFNPKILTINDNELNKLHSSLLSLVD